MSDKDSTNSATPTEPATEAIRFPGAAEIRGASSGNGWIILAVAIAILAAMTIVSVLFAPRPAEPAAQDPYLGTWSSTTQTLTISADGRAQGSDGCNGQGTNWMSTDSGIRFDGFVGTLMACMGDDGRMTNGWLGRASSAQLEGLNYRELAFFDSKGERLGSLSRGSMGNTKPGNPPTDGPMAPGPRNPADDGSGSEDPMASEPLNPRGPSEEMPGRPDPRPLDPGFSTAGPKIDNQPKSSGS